MQDLFRKIESPALVDLRLQWPGSVTAQLASNLPGDLYSGDPLVVLARLPALPEQGQPEVGWSYSSDVPALPSLHCCTLGLRCPDASLCPDASVACSDAPAPSRYCHVYCSDDRVGMPG